MSRTRTTPRAEAHKWEFKARFRRHAFGWKSQPAIQRVKQAVSEIKKVVRRDPVLAAEGAVVFLERVSPAIEQVDGSSGAIGTAVNRAVEDLVAIIAEAPADAPTRDAWLERLWEAHADDQIPYIERLADYWGDLCASKETASAWVDRLLGITRSALSPDKSLREHFHGTTACLSALYRAERYSEIIGALVTTTPGDEGKWFTAAKELGLFDAAIALARTSPCDPKTLARAARDHAAEQPAFAVEAGHAALAWLVEGFGYEITSADVWLAYSAAMKAGETLGRAVETKERIRQLADGRYSFVMQVLGRELGPGR